MSFIAQMLVHVNQSSCSRAKQKTGRASAITLRSITDGLAKTPLVAASAEPFAWEATCTPAMARPEISCELAHDSSHAIACGVEHAMLRPCIHDSGVVSTADLVTSAALDHASRHFTTVGRNVREQNQPFQSKRHARGGTC